MRLVLGAASTASWCARAWCWRRRRSAREIITVEGAAARASGELTDVQQAFVDEGAVQCGFCTPGLVMAVHDLLDRDARPDRPRGARGDLAATCAAAPATAGCSPPSRRRSTSVGARRWRPMTDDRRRPSTDRHRPPRRPRSASAPRPDGGPKVRGEFAFCGDLWADGMLWGAHAALAAPVGPHPRRSTSRPALADARRRAPCSPPTTCPARSYYGLEHRDQPVFADDVVRYAGEPVAAVAADHPETARRAVRGDRRRLRRRSTRSSTPRPRSTAPPIHPDGNVFRHLVHPPRRPRPRGARSWSRAPTRSACRTRRSWAPRPGWPSRPRTAASTSSSSTQWLHDDRDQVAECLGLPAGAGAAHPRRRRRRVRRPRGRQPADPRLPARPAHRPPGEDGVLPARSRSSATCTATRRASGCATTPTPTARS